MPEALRVPLSRLKANPGGYLESARSRRVLLTRRGRVVGELVPMGERWASPRRRPSSCSWAAGGTWRGSTRPST